MKEPQVPHSASREGVKAVQAALESVRPFDAEQRADFPFAPARFDLFGRAHQPELVGMSLDGLVESVDLFVDRPGQPTHSLRDGEGDEAEELRSHPSLSHTRQVDVPAERRMPQRWLVSRMQVVA